MKVCTKCCKEKKETEFWSDRRLKSGLHSWCKSCCSIQRKKWSNSSKGKESIRRREQKRSKTEKRIKWKLQYKTTHKYKTMTKNSALKYKFNITLDDYNKLYEEQNGVCAICGLPEIAKRKTIQKMLAVDHNHNSNKIRGLLCSKCNQAIGLLNVDNFGTLNLQMAIKYIRRLNNGRRK